MARSRPGGRGAAWLGAALLAVAAARVAAPVAVRRVESVLLWAPGHVLRWCLLPWRPGTVAAAARRSEDPQARAAAVLLRGLRDAAGAVPAATRNGATGVTVAVRELRARAPGRRPDQLVLDARGGSPGDLVVSGDVLLGFLAAPAADAPGGLAVVDLLWRAPERGAGSPRRLLAAAAPAVPGTSDETVRFVVEPAGTQDPFPLRLIKPDRPQVNTWRDGVEFLAQTLALDAVPAGLRLGRVRTRGYLSPDFVLEWYLEPEWDATALHTVTVLAGTTPVVPCATRERVPVRALARFALPGGRELLLVGGADLEPGSAVVAGERLIGQVAARAGPVLTVRPFLDPGVRWPVLLWEDATGGPVEFLVEPRDSHDGLVRCQVLPARRDRPVHGDPARPAGLLFTGAVAAATPAGLLLGECRWLATDVLEVATPGPGLPQELTGVRLLPESSTRAR